MRVAWYLGLAIVWVVSVVVVTQGRAAEGNSQAGAVDRSPVDLAVFANGKWLVTANQTANSVS